jgi:hypothetical protein
MTTIDDLLAEITVREKTVKILLRQDLLDEHARRDAELVATLNADTEENRDPLGPDLAKKLVEFEAEIEAAKRPFRFRAIGKKAWADLLAHHPPTRDQTTANPRLDHNPVTFPIAAIAASCVDPQMTVEQVSKLEERLNLAQFEMLWAGCLDANVGGGVDAPKSLVAGPIARAKFELERSVSGMDDPSLDRSSSVG